METRTNKYKELRAQLKKESEEIEKIYIDYIIDSILPSILYTE